MKSFFYIIILTLIIKNSYSEVMLLNCISADSKNFSFYKWKKKENSKPQVFIRPIKSKWVDFCHNYDTNSSVKCVFLDYTVKRTFYKKHAHDSFYSTTTFIDFKKKKLEISIDDNIKNYKDNLKFNCKKAKI